MKTTFDFKIPSGWTELSDKHLTYLFRLIADFNSADEIKMLCLLKWSGSELVARSGDRRYILRSAGRLLEVSSIDIAQILSALDWIEEFPEMPVRISRLGRHKALPADFAGVPFESYIIADNLYQGYMATGSEPLLDELATVLYNAPLRPKQYQRINVFYWMTSLKNLFNRRFPDLFQPPGPDNGNLLGSPVPDVEEAMNAQIRALTKGDVTKEKIILSIDTWRALTELNAQALEYKRLNQQIKK